MNAVKSLKYANNYKTQNMMRKTLYYKPNFNASFSKKFFGQVIRVVRGQNKVSDSGINQHFSAERTGIVCAVKHCVFYRHAMHGSLDDRILLSMQPAAKLMPFSGGHLQLFPQAANLKTVAQPAGCSIVAGGQYAFVLNQQSPDLPAGAG
jgi:hypothetical protein